MKAKPFCVIVDDEESSLALLKSKIEEIDLLEIEQSFLDPEKFLLNLSKLKSEIIFLDMEMPIDGDEVAKKLKNKKIIFVSGHKDLAYKAYDVDAIDFVPKPISTFRLKQAIEKAVKSITSTFVVIKTEDAKKEEINYDTIIYISTHKAEKRDKDFYLSDGTSVRAKGVDISDLIAELPSDKFCKINSSEIVNLSYVKKLLSSDSIGITINSRIKELTLSESCKQIFFAQKPHLRG
jgi:DNA-binding LytR/AlgR family response regulator